MNYAITRTDGGVSIMSLTSEAIIETEVQKYTKLHGDYVSHRTLDASEIPQDQTYRNAWKDLGSGVLDVDILKAKDIQLELLRAERIPLLTSMDAQINKLSDSGDSQGLSALQAKRQALRDVTNDLKTLNPISLDEVKKAGSLDKLKDYL